MGELGLCRLCGFKLIEQRDQLRFLLRRKEGEDAFLGLVFALLLRFQAIGIVGVGVPGVDLHDVVDQTQEHDPGNVDRFVGVFLQKVGHDRHVP